MARWADVVEALPPATSTRPIQSVPLTERSWTQCGKCGASFYLNARGKPAKYCRECYTAWKEKRYKKKTTPSPSSSAMGSSEGDANDGGMLKDLEKVFARPNLAPKKILSRPPPPPPPPAPLPQPLDVTALLTVLSAPPPPPPSRPKMIDRGCQTGRAPRHRRAPSSPL